MVYAFRAQVEGQRIVLTESNPLEGRYEAIVILTTPLNTGAASQDGRTAKPDEPPALQKGSAAPFAAAVQPARPAPVAAYSAGLRQGPPGERAGNPSGLSTLKDAASGIAPRAPVPAGETLSQLYHDKANRDARRNSSGGSGDKYVDVNRDTYQRFMQGEQIALAFEEGGNFITSPFILVENCTQLYINFHQFNETKPLPLDKAKILSLVFDITGDFPGFVDTCKPAIMVPRNGAYVIKNKGELSLTRLG